MAKEPERPAEVGMRVGEGVAEAGAPSSASLQRRGSSSPRPASAAPAGLPLRRAPLLPLLALLLLRATGRPLDANLLRLRGRGGDGEGAHTSGLASCGASACSAAQSLSRGAAGESQP